MIKLCAFNGIFKLIQDSFNFKNSVFTQNLFLNHIKLSIRRCPQCTRIFIAPIDYYYFMMQKDFVKSSYILEDNFNYANTTVATTNENKKSYIKLQ